MRLFHREYECYVSAEGSFAEASKVVVEDGMCLVVSVSCSCDPCCLPGQCTVVGGRRITASSSPHPPLPTPSGRLRRRVILAVESHSAGESAAASDTCPLAATWQSWKKELEITE